MRDLSAYVEDPFSAAVMDIKEALERALDDGVSGAMNETEYLLLEKIAVILTQEAAVEVEPRVG